MEHVLPVRLVGTVLAVIAHAHQVSMGMAANRHVHAAERMSPVIHKQGNVGGVTLDGLDPDVKIFVPMELMATLAPFYVTHVLMGAAITSLENAFVNQAFKEKVVTVAALFCILAQTVPHSVTVERELAATLSPVLAPIVPGEL